MITMNIAYNQLFKETKHKCSKPNFSKHLGMYI